MILQLLQRFVKDDIREGIDKFSKLFDLAKDLSDSNIHRDTAKVGCGFVADRTLQEMSLQREGQGKVSPRDVFSVRTATRKLCIAIIDKLLENLL